METYRILKVDTRLYIKGLSGPLVFRALYGIIASFLFQNSSCIAFNF